MPEYIIKQADRFIARVEADSSVDAMKVLRKHVGLASEEATGQAIFVHLKAALEGLPDEFETSDPLSGFVVQERVDSRPETMDGKVCAYCGSGICTSPQGDHVVARGFFDEAKRNNTIVYIRVPACDACNGRKSASETVAIPLLALHAGPDHPDAGQITQEGGPVHRSFSKVPDVWKRLLKGAQEVFAPVGPSGILMPTFQFDAQWSDIRFVVQLITQGLYFYHTNNRIPDTFEIVVTAVGEQGLLSYQTMVAGHTTIAAVDLGQGVFDYVMIPSSDGNLVLTIMSFYGKNHFVTKALPTKQPGDVLRLDHDMPFAPKGVYILRSNTDDAAELSSAQEIDQGQIRTTGTRIKVARHELAVFKPNGSRVESGPP